LRSSILAAAAALVLAGCKTPTALTAQATGCGVTEIEIVDSDYKRQGATTAWCARCKERLYQCVTTPGRDRVECREPRPGATPCG
jgi:hypothetical protein